MNTETSSKADESSVLDKASGVIDRAWQAQWSLKLVCMLLFFEISILIYLEKGILQWPEVERKILQDIGLLAVIVVAFSFSVSIAIPVLVTIIRGAVYPLANFASEVLSKIFSNTESTSINRYPGWVYASAFRDHALELNSDFLYKIYQDHLRVENSYEKLRKDLGFLIGAVLMLVYLDWEIVAWRPTGISLIRTLLEYFGEYSGAFVISATLPTLYILKLLWFPKYQPDLIYYPPLDRELREREKKRRKELGVS